MGCPDQRSARVDVVSTIESLFVIGASFVAIAAGGVAFGRWVIRRFVKAVKPVIREVVTEEMAPVTARLEAELSGNSGGLRQALDELHVKVDTGFEKTTAEFVGATAEMTVLTARVNTIEQERADRDGDTK